MRCPESRSDRRGNGGVSPGKCVDGPEGEGERQKSIAGPEDDIANEGYGEGSKKGR